MPLLSVDRMAPVAILRPQARIHAARGARVAPLTAAATESTPVRPSIAISPAGKQKTTLAIYRLPKIAKSVTLVCLCLYLS
jgi:hypothetical protein